MLEDGMSRGRHVAAEAARETRDGVCGDELRSGAPNGLVHAAALESTAKAVATWYRPTKACRQHVLAAFADTFAAKHGKFAGKKVLLKSAV
jgi:hypothetical protein